MQSGGGDDVVFFSVNSVCMHFEYTLSERLAQVHLVVVNRANGTVGRGKWSDETIGERKGESVHRLWGGNEAMLPLAQLPKIDATNHILPLLCVSFFIGNSVYFHFSLRPCWKKNGYVFIIFCTRIRRHLLFIIFHS